MLWYELIPKIVSNITTKSLLRTYSSDLKLMLHHKIPHEIEVVKEFRKSYGQMRMGETTIEQMYAGMRNVKGLIWETSVLDTQHGIRFRGHSLRDCMDKLPKVEGSSQPLPEGIFWLLITGDIPNENQVHHVTQEWARRSTLSDQTKEVLHVLRKLHPLGQLSAAALSMSNDSKFRKALKNNVHKDKYWEFVYEDAMDLLGKLNVVAALIYKNSYHHGPHQLPQPDPSRDWTYNYAKMIGFDKPDFIEMLRMYMSIHADHEGGNVSSHAVHVVGSALSDPYLAYSAGVNGLAGPLHGLANETVLIWLNELLKKVGDKYTDDDLKEYIWISITSGHIIPGYGNPVLTKTDPRFMIMRNFAKQHLPHDKLCKLISDLHVIIPPILSEVAKVKNPWPNCMAHSGALLQQYGMLDINYHTVMFAVSRAIGVMAQLVWSRALSFPIERPKSYSTAQLRNKVGLY